MAEDTFWVKIWLILATAIVVVCLVISLYSFTVKAVAFEKGYQQVMVKGYCQPVWQKITKGEE